MFTILILEKLTRPSSVKLGVPSSMKARSARYIPRYGTHGGLQLHMQTHNANIIFQRAGLKHLLMYFPLVISSIYFFSVSLRFLNLPSDDTVFCSLSMSAFVYETQRSCSGFVEGVRFILSSSLRSRYPPVCTLWPRSSSACRWRSGWERKWSPALRYNCWGSDRYQPLQAIFLWSWPWSPHQCGSLSETPPGYSSVVRGWEGWSSVC